MKGLILVILLYLIMMNLLARKLPPLSTVENVDLNKYAGLWYQFAYFPNNFQPKDAKLTTAEYIPTKKGYITVINTAYKDYDGEVVKSNIKGKAYIEDKVNKSKLKVQFFWPFRGAYWITLLDKEEYQWAVVSDPSRKYLWILNRKPTMDKDLYQKLIQQIAARGIDINKIVITGRFE